MLNLNHGRLGFVHRYSMHNICLFGRCLSSLLRLGLGLRLRLFGRTCCRFLRFHLKMLRLLLFLLEGWSQNVTHLFDLMMRWFELFMVHGSLMNRRIGNKVRLRL